MKILSVQSLEMADVKIIRYERFPDHRGYFSETFRRSDIQGNEFLAGAEIVQANETVSHAGCIRGLHFQWNPKMGKLVRTIYGHMIDLVLDIRINSPTFGMVVAHDMPANTSRSFGEWIWVPPGFAHGTMYTETSAIEYLCTGEYNQDCEAAISPLANDIDWSLCDSPLKAVFEQLRQAPMITPKDRDGFSVSAWRNDERSKNFMR